MQEGFRLEGIEGPPKSLEDRIHAVMEAKGMAAAKYISPKAGMAASILYGYSVAAFVPHHLLCLIIIHNRLQCMPVLPRHGTIEIPCLAGF